jgi:hypothetical protein
MEGDFSFLFHMLKIPQQNQSKHEESKHNKVNHNNKNQNSKIIISYDLFICPIIIHFYFQKQ